MIASAVPVRARCRMSRLIPFREPAQPALPFDHGPVHWETLPAPVRERVVALWTQMLIAHVTVRSMQRPRITASPPSETGRASDDLHQDHDHSPPARRVYLRAAVHDHAGPRARRSTSTWRASAASTRSPSTRARTAGRASRSWMRTWAVGFGPRGASWLRAPGGGGVPRGSGRRLCA